MNLSGSKKARVKLKGMTPATVAIAVLYLGLVVYFMVESYFLSPEQYAGNPPYLLIATLGLVTVFATFFTLGKIEPGRSDTLSYALLIGMGFMFFLYPFMTRVNFWLDDGSLETHVYVLNSDYTWVAKDADTPNIDMYIESSLWWQQYQPG
ncbi:MAG: hypothetical protein KJP04_00870, partial [Arenicella sp.]|nr:hypothetical protein [Arenicella sp.]